MSQPIDVGSVLGGRYKVTANVLTSHDQDLVLDGVDQVLNRPVSILVAGPSNSEQVVASAREVAMGERPGGVQVLDLGVSEETTYLITNHASAAELLDLLVAPNPPYVEPFFTDTLGSEIFGRPRSQEPEADHDADSAGYIRYDDSHQSQMSPYPATGNSTDAPRPATRPSPAVPGPGLPGSTEADHSENAAPGTPAYGTATPGAAEAAGAAAASASRPAKDSPKVSLWTEEDHSYEVHEQHHDDNPERTERSPKTFPAFARTSAGAGAGAGSAAATADDVDDTDDSDDAVKEPRSVRWLVGALLAMVLVAGLVFALTQLGTLFPSTSGPQANQPSESSSTTQAPSPSEAPAPAPEPVTPVIESITRQGTFDFASTYDAELVKAYDGNPASFWSNMEFATENWGGLVSGSVPLVIKLQEPSTVSSVTLTQLGASGGRINVLTNDRPSLEGAKQVGTNSFTSTDLIMPLAEPVTAQYVIIQIDTLPRLAAPKTMYNYGLRLAEVKVQ